MLEKISMTAQQNRCWMDMARRRHVPHVQYKPPALIGTLQESRDLIAARTALRARMGVSQEELYLLALDRREKIVRGKRPRRVVLMLALFAMAGAACIVGNRMASQPVFLLGLALASIAFLLGCAIASACLQPQLGELGDYINEGEAPASAEEIVWLLREARQDPELDKMLQGWWKSGSAPIRKQDLSIVHNFQKAKQRVSTP
jgi:hypothetical protein